MSRKPNQDFEVCHSSLKYLVPAQAIIIGFKIVENCSWAIPGHVSCRPGNFRPVQTGLKIIILLIRFWAVPKLTRNVLGRH